MSYNPYKDVNNLNGPAIDATITYIGGLAVDTIGNIYISDEVNCVIRKVDTFGIIHLFAGPEPVIWVYSNGCSGDGGPATAARMSSPWGLAIDHSGNLYISDDDCGVIRKIDTTGIITTVAGKDTLGGFSGDGGPATDAGISQPLS